MARGSLICVWFVLLCTANQMKRGGGANSNKQPTPNRNLSAAAAKRTTPQVQRSATKSYAAAATASGAGGAGSARKSILTASAGGGNRSSISVSAAAQAIVPVQLTFTDNKHSATDDAPDVPSHSVAPAPAPVVVSSVPITVAATETVAAPSGPRSKLDELRDRQAANRARYMAHASDIPAILGKTIDHSAMQKQQQNWDESYERFVVKPSYTASAAPAITTSASAVSAASGMKSPKSLKSPKSNLKSPKSNPTSTVIIPATSAVVKTSPAIVFSASDLAAQSEGAAAGEDENEGGEDDRENESGDDQSGGEDATAMQDVAISIGRTPIKSAPAPAAAAVISPKSRLLSPKQAAAAATAIVGTPKRPEQKTAAESDDTESEPENDENAAPPHPNTLTHRTPNRNGQTTPKATAAVSFSPVKPQATIAAPPIHTGSDSTGSSMDLGAPPINGFTSGGAATEHTHTDAEATHDHHHHKAGRDYEHGHSSIEMHIHSTAAAAREADRHEQYARAVARMDADGVASASASDVHASSSVGVHKQTRHFGEFVEGGKYPRVEAELIVKVDLLRRSNILNDDKYDFALVINSPQHPIQPLDGGAAAAAINPLTGLNAAERRKRDRALKKKHSQFNASVVGASAMPAIDEKKADSAAGAGAGAPMPFGTPPPHKSKGSAPAQSAYSTPQLQKKNTKRGGAGGNHGSGRSIAAQIEDRLRAAGLYVKREDSKVAGRYLLKLMAPPERLELEAERMHLKLRLKNGGYCQFERSLRQHIEGVDENTLFRSSERQLIIDHILKSKVEDGGADVYCAQFYSAIELAFPLHMYARQFALNESWVKYWKQK